MVEINLESVVPVTLKVGRNGLTVQGEQIDVSTSFFEM